MSAPAKKRPSALASRADRDRRRLERLRAVRPFPLPVVLRYRVQLVTRNNLALLSCGHVVAVGAAGKQAFDAGDLPHLACARCAEGEA